MRQIKFRAWDGYGKAWLNDNISIALSGQKYYNHRDNGTFEKIENALQDLANTVIVMQYTGLKDKNGAEAYICDIAKDEFGNIIEITEDYVLLANLQIIQFEIIGNKYENPELEECLQRQ